MDKVKIQVFQYENYRRAPGRRGNAGCSAGNLVSFRDEHQWNRSARGAVYVLQPEDGSVLGVSVSDSSGTFRIKSLRTAPTPSGRPERRRICVKQSGVQLYGPERSGRNGSLPGGGCAAGGADSQAGR